MKRKKGGVKKENDGIGTPTIHFLRQTNLRLEAV